MTITFENDNDVIIYALEKVIAYTRKTEQMFVAQCVWWLASIIGLEQGLINYVDNIQSRVYVAVAAEALPNEISGTRANQDTETERDLRKVSRTPPDIQEDPRERCTSDIVHPDRRVQIQVTDSDTSSLDLKGSRQGNIVKETKEFFSLSRKERKAAYKRIHDKLTRTRFSKVIKPITKKQRNYLQSIPKDTMEDYLKNRK